MSLVRAASARDTVLLYGTDKQFAVFAIIDLPFWNVSPQTGA